jgi:hypothetical protein
VLLMTNTDWELVKLEEVRLAALLCCPCCCGAVALLLCCAAMLLAAVLGEKLHAAAVR